MKRNQMEILGLKNRETEMKNSLDELNNDLRGKKKELVNMEIEQIKVSILKNREKKDWRRKNRASETCRTMWIIPRRREERRRSSKLFEETVARDFANLLKSINVQIQEAQSTPNRTTTKRTTSRHSVVKLRKDKGIMRK